MSDMLALFWSTFEHLDQSFVSILDRMPVIGNVMVSNTEPEEKSAELPFAQPKSTHHAFAEGA